ncbi:hypothetical protein OHA25_60285 (plasmid) [Nonomuraea sp. NBC_00507]|uniref:hypothetical protein n=1 Tax=Nonomuraea sp. NBC_00507 TaxID=2976002 RepID=UPI002E16BED3
MNSFSKPTFGAHARWFIGTILITTVLVGCASNDRVVLPSQGATLTVPSRSPEPPPSTTPGQQAAIIEAYEAYWKIGMRSSQVPLAQARKMLRPYTTPEFLKHVLDGLQRQHEKGQVVTGAVKTNVIDVTVKGGTARVTDCQDTTGVIVTDAASGRAVSGSRGEPRAHVQADLAQGTDRRWRIYQVIVLERPCTVSPS